MFFYFWRDFSARVTESAILKYRCERCGDTFCFEAVRTATASGHSPFMLDDENAARRAEWSATTRARTALRTLHFPVPCPTCGWYQRAMFPAVRRQMYKWMYTAGIILVFFTLFAFLIGAMFGGYLTGGICAAASTVAGVALLAGMVVRRRLFDPNARIPQAVRVERGREMAVPASLMPLPLPMINYKGQIVEPPPEDDWS